MAVKCNACFKYMSVKEGVVCPRCKEANHRACVNIPNDAQIHSSWLCPKCKAALPTNNENSTPLRGAGITYVLDDSLAESSATQPASMELCSSAGTAPPSIIAPEYREPEPDLSTELRQFCAEMRQTREEFRAFRQEMLEMRALVSSCDARLTKLEARVVELEQRATGGSEVGHGDVICMLEATVAQLQQDLDDRDQEMLQNDIEISGVPEESGENVTHLVAACAAKLGMTVDDREIVSCMRVGGVRADSGGVPRPRNIAVRLARRTARDQFLRAARVRRTLTTEGMGLRSEPRRVYVNERLTKRNRSLFGRARMLASGLNWRFVWTRDGRIFTRRDQGDPVNRIRSEKDLDSVFGSAQVRPAPAAAGRNIPVAAV
ncbi:uncharacterized protein LOC126370826 [Pectinophora gossypiella]|uniref:uncharacterized protein LOC126370826 n=1 Tax=Pectinophora gossypiella TaxID=13191 RepID=UPI00214F0AAC|nr:uncharacterized protein LOC126370826 [Pectinophora gossypiella]